MNTLVSVAIAPFGVGDELSDYVNDIIGVIEESGLPYRTTAMATEIEGEWDAVFAVVKAATETLTAQGIRAYVSLNADIRPGHLDTMHSKLEKINHELKN
ncbi:MAG: MTH1187 family thiamine-binding protein [Lactobacillaceae bacterium]|jgi:uncharacterized protein (TIGR00106 family)|nr:MTH1187 family thiamine-binding protein [Lactobacillaceae bacterium]